MFTVKPTFLSGYHKNHRFWSKLALRTRPRHCSCSHAHLLGGEEPELVHSICGSVLSHSVSLQGSNPGNAGRITPQVTILRRASCPLQEGRVSLSQYKGERYAAKPQRQTSCGRSNARNAGRKHEGNRFKHVYTCPQADSSPRRGGG